MKRVISKVRERKAKTREKRAGKASRSGSSFKESPIVGLSIGFLLWFASVALIGTERMTAGLKPSDLLLVLSADGAFLIAGLLCTALFLQMVKPGFLRQTHQLLLVCAITLMSVLPARAVLYANESFALVGPDVVGFLLPFAMAPLLATILADGTLGVAAGIWTSLVIAIMAGNSFPLFLTGAVASVVTSCAAHRVRTRSRVAKIGLFAGFCELICVLAVAAMAAHGSQQARSSSAMLVVYQAGACLGSGFLSAILVLLILPLFEALFRITTDITLLEISDLGQPLLQRLAIEAPGTYHHSLVVANLAQAAADEIGANSLIARVSAYFHDVGKLTKPDFFTENIGLRPNPHDDLAPSMSTLIITAHVKEGVSLGMVHKLPDPIMKVIREHHGTSLLAPFHHKAVSEMELELGHADGVQTNGHSELDEGDFRYPGPRPSSRESAIVCLADAVEAASRSLAKPKPGQIEGLVHDIVSAKLQDDQLADCELILSELPRIKRSFVFTLTNMLHGRVPYPKDENRNKQQPRGPQAKQTEDQKTDSVPDE